MRGRREVAVEGWHPVEDVIQWGFTRTPVVMSGIDPFVIDQTVIVAFRGLARAWVPALLADLADILAACGGTAGILRELAPAPLNGHTGVDAVVVSTNKALA